MGYKDTDRFIKSTTLKGMAWNVMIVICHYANAETGAAWPSQATIAEQAKCSTKTVQRAVKEAEAAGELVIVPGNGRGKSTRYIVLVGMSEAERAERLTLNGQKVDNQCLPLAEKVDISKAKGGQKGRHLATEKVDKSEQKVDTQMSYKREYKDIRREKDEKGKERERGIALPPEYQKFLEYFYKMTGKTAKLPIHRDLLEPLAMEMFAAGYRLDDLLQVEAATAWMQTPPTPKQVVELIGQQVRPVKSSQFGGKKGDYSDFIE